MPEPDIQPSYSPITMQQSGWHAESHREREDEENANDNEQLIENDEGTPLQEPYMRASKIVSMVLNFLMGFFTFLCLC